MTLNDPLSVYFKYKKLIPYSGLKGKLPIIDSDTFVGVEEEIEGVVDNIIIPATWNRVQDGSLKDNGVEFVSIPMEVKYLEIELQRLSKSLNKKFRVSSRCSVHVHINVQDLSLEQLKILVLTYMVFEKLLYKYSGNRWNSIFCVPLYLYNDNVIKFMKTKTPEYLKSIMWHKYSGLNLSPIWGGVGEHESKQCLGTVEFRQMKGNLSIPYIINWINLILCLKSFAQKESLKSFIEKIKVMNTDSSYYSLGELVFGNFIHLLNTGTTEELKQELETCIRRTKLCINEEILKEYSCKIII